MAVLDDIVLSSGGVGRAGFCLTNLAILFGFGLLGYFSVSTYTIWRRLRHIPGPRSAGFSKWWMLRNTLGGNMHLALKAACETYGKRRWTNPGSKLPGPSSLYTRQDMHIVTSTWQPETFRNISPDGLPAEHVRPMNIELALMLLCRPPRPRRAEYSRDGRPRGHQTPLGRPFQVQEV